MEEVWRKLRKIVPVGFGIAAWHNLVASPSWVSSQFDNAAFAFSFSFATAVVSGVGIGTGGSGALLGDFRPDCAPATVKENTPIMVITSRR